MINTKHIGIISYTGQPQRASSNTICKSAISPSHVLGAQSINAIQLETPVECTNTDLFHTRRYNQIISKPTMEESIIADFGHTLRQFQLIFQLGHARKRIITNLGDAAIGRKRERGTAILHLCPIHQCMFAPITVQHAVTADDEFAVVVNDALVGVGCGVVVGVEDESLSVIANMAVNIVFGWQIRRPHMMIITNVFR